MRAQVRVDRRAIDGTMASWVKANASGSRMTPEIIILHDTAGQLTPGSSVSWFASAECQTSAHLVIERDGRVTQMVPFDVKAFHAGESNWRGRRYCNSFAIGIEIVNPGLMTRKGDIAQAWFHKGAAGIPISQCVEMATSEHGKGWWLPYTSEQIEAVTEICRALVVAYPTIVDITTHWQVSPGRKIDTGPQFPLEQIRAACLGARRGPGPRTGMLALGSRGEAVRDAQLRLKELGYAIGAVDGVFGPQTRAAVLAFEAENRLDTDGALSPDEISILRSIDAKSMPVGAREEATLADLREAGSRQAQVGQAMVNTGKALTGGTIADQASKMLFDFSPLDTVISGMDRTVQFVGKSSSLGLALPPRLIATLVAVAVGIALWNWGGNVAWRRLMDHRRALNLGR